MRSRAERISRALVRRYPRAWRERYGEEMLALIDDSGSTWKHTLDLAIGCADAWFPAATRHFFAPINWIASLLGFAAVRLGSAIAIHFGLIPPAPLQNALQGAFALIVLFLFGSMFLLPVLAFAMAFRKAWNQWFGMIRGHMPEPIDPQIATARVKAMTDLGPTRRQIHMLVTVTILIAIGADISTHDQTVSSLLRLPADFIPIPVVPWFTYWLIAYFRMCLLSLRMLRQLASERRRPSRVE